MCLGLSRNMSYTRDGFKYIVYGVRLAPHYVAQFGSSRASANIAFLAYSTAVFASIMTHVIAQSFLGELNWTVGAGVPGGFASYYVQKPPCVWCRAVGTAASMLSNLLANGLLAFQCHMGWSIVYIAALLCIIYATTLSLGIFELCFFRASLSDFIDAAVRMGFACYGASIVLILFATVLILERGRLDTRPRQRDSILTKHIARRRDIRAVQRGRRGGDPALAKPW
ncbi:hypothetical protein BC834DRAFT_858552 [Gloeopeniophorella convolvens]|nr:hypothetical protein BC834DRAFT_858552 [Gloeopeniophorella convolvens]